MNTVHICVRQIGSLQTLRVSDALGGLTWEMTTASEPFTLTSNDGIFGHVMILSTAGDLIYENAVGSEISLKAPSVEFTVSAGDPKNWIKITDHKSAADNEQAKYAEASPLQMSVAAT